MYVIKNNTTNDFPMKWINLYSNTEFFYYIDHYKYCKKLDYEVHCPAQQTDAQNLAAPMPTAYQPIAKLLPFKNSHGLPLVSIMLVLIYFVTINLFTTVYVWLTSVISVLMGLSY